MDEVVDEKPGGDDASGDEIESLDAAALAALGDELEADADDEAQEAAMLAGYAAQGGELTKAQKDLVSAQAAIEADDAAILGDDTGAAASKADAAALDNPGNEDDPPATDTARPAGTESHDEGEERIRRIEGRLGDFNDKFLQLSQQIEKAFAQAAPPGGKGQTPSAAQVAAARADATGERWQALVLEYPEWGDAIDERVGPMEALIRTMKGDMDQLRGQLAQERSNSITRELNGWDWNASVSTKTFRDWYETVATGAIRQAAAVETVESQASVMRAYEAYMGNRQDDPHLAAARAKRQPAAPGRATRPSSDALEAMSDLPSARGSVRRGPLTEEEAMQAGYDNA